MCFNPKVAKLADVAAKDISKAVLKKLAKVAPNEAKAVPFFLQTKQ